MKSKSKVTMLVVAVLLSLLSSVNVQASKTGKCGDNITWTLDDKGNLELTGKGKMYDYSLMGAPWGTSIVSVTISEGIENLGKYALSFCGKLTNVVIPNSVKEILDGAFRGCDGLETVTIGESVASIGPSAFSGCRELLSVTIPSAVKVIETKAFFNCGKLTSFSVDKENKTYDSRGNCNAIIETATNTLIYGCKNTVIPNTVTKIGEEAFAYSVALTSIEIPNSVTDIKSGAFSGCSGLTGVVIPSSVINLEGHVFYGCESLTSMVIPNSVKSIGAYTLYGCRGLKSVVVGESVASVGNAAFKECSGLTRLEMLTKVPPKCGKDVFVGVDKTACELVVPAGCVDVYKTAVEWGDFSKITPGESSVGEVGTPGMSVTAAGGEIVVEGVADAAVEVYGIGGSLLYSGKSHRVSVPVDGIYVVRVNGKPHKVVIK